MYNFGRSHSNGSGTVGVGGGSGHVSCRSSGTDSIGKIKIPIIGILILPGLPVPLLLITCNGKDHFVLYK